MLRGSCFEGWSRSTHGEANARYGIIRCLQVQEELPCFSQRLSSDITILNGSSSLHCHPDISNLLEDIRHECSITDLRRCRWSQVCIILPTKKEEPIALPLKYF
jgi:hypothetical protein